MRTPTLTQLPNDAVSVGYKTIGRFQYEQVFRSESANFEGTEYEFLEAGHAYAYVQIDKYTRVVVEV